MKLVKNVDPLKVHKAIEIMIGVAIFGIGLYFGIMTLQAKGAEWVYQTYTVPTFTQVVLVNPTTKLTMIALVSPNVSVTPLAKTAKPHSK